MTKHLQKVERKERERVGVRERNREREIELKWRQIKECQVID